MALHWDELQKALSPIKDYEDLCQRLMTSFGYPFIVEKFNLTMPELASYTQKLLEGDARRRYDDYAAKLIQIIAVVERAGVKNVLDLKIKVETREKLAEFTHQSGIEARDIIMLLKYLIYWFIPGEKYLSGLIQDDPETRYAIKRLGERGIRTNLALLQQGRSEAGRKSLAEATGLAESIISGLVNRADFSRLPWSSKATISNIIGAGYSSLEMLASADAEQLLADFFSYGMKIGKNLKLGNEIENSYRIAKLVPRIV